MKIFYRIILILLAIAAAYSLYGIIHFKWMYHRVDNPKAEFFVSGNPNGSVTVVEFINYGCIHCKNLHPVMKEALSVRKDVRYVVRPIAYGEGFTDRLTRIVIAAGLQGKFWDLHDAFLEHPEPDIPDDFIEETALLYGLDYEQLMNDADGKKVRKLADNNYAVLEHVGIYSIPSFVVGQKIYRIEETIPTLKNILSMITEAEKN